MRIAIHQPQYMPWCGYLHKMASVDLFVFLNDVQFKKNEWQHRNRIRNAVGSQWLSVPTDYSFPRTINEVKTINSIDWRRKHALSIQTCYGGSPAFGTVWPKFNEFFQKSWDTIDRANIGSIALLADLLDIRTPCVISSDHSFQGASTLRLVNMCKHFGATAYLAGAGGHGYMDLALFEEAGIAVEFQKYHTPVYAQRFCRSSADFIPNLSAIDLIFNCAEGRHALLMSGSTPENERIA